MRGACGFGAVGARVRRHRELERRQEARRPLRHSMPLSAWRPLPAGVLHGRRGVWWSATSLAACIDGDRVASSSSHGLIFGVSFGVVRDLAGNYGLMTLGGRFRVRHGGCYDGSDRQLARERGGEDGWALDHTGLAEGGSRRSRTCPNYICSNQDAWCGACGRRRPAARDIGGSET